MAENMKESLSALIDGEASEIELHRLLRAINQDHDLKQSWVTYHQIRSVLSTQPVYSTQQHLELNRRIGAAVDSETDFVLDTSPLARNNRYIKPLGGLAIAASLVLAVMVGFNQLNQVSPTGQDAASNNPALVNLTSPKTDTNPVAAQLVDNRVLDPDIESDLRKLSPETEKRFRAYLMRMDRQMGPPPGQVVIYKDSKAP